MEGRALAAAEQTGADPFDRITFDPSVMGGRACIRGMRITVATIIGEVAERVDAESVLRDDPDLEPADIRQALAYGAGLAREDVVPA